MIQYNKSYVPLGSGIDIVFALMQKNQNEPEDSRGQQQKPLKIGYVLFEVRRII